MNIVGKSQYGYCVIILAAASAALIHVLSKPMLDSGSNIEINPIVMAFLIYFICGIFFTPLVRKTSGNTKFVKKDIILMAIIGILEVSGGKPFSKPVIFRIPCDVGPTVNATCQNPISSIL